MLVSRPKGCRFEPHRHHCVVSLSKNINTSLVLVQLRKTCPFITERLLMGRKESNQTKQTNNMTVPGSVAQSEISLIAVPRVVSSISARPHTFVEIDHERFYTVILLLRPTTDSRRVGVSSKQKYVHKVTVLVNCTVKLAQEKVWLG